MKYTTLEEVNQRINSIVDQLLVNLAQHPASRYLFSLPVLEDENREAPVLDCQEYGYCIANLREVITYKYLLDALKSKQLEVNKQNLYACIKNMRRSPVIDYYDLADYHEYAYYYYKKLGNEKKANSHLLSCYYDRGRAILSCEKTFDCKELLLVLLKDRKRLLSFILYVVDFVGHDFEDYQEFFTRSQYLLIERSLVLAEKVFEENASADVDLRCVIYYVLSLYYKQTKRPEMAKKAKTAYLKLGGRRKYNDLLEDVVEAQLDPHWMDERFLDYILYGCTLEDDEICTLDEDENISFDIDDEYSVWEKEERMNFMDAYYRVMDGSMKFKKIYDLAEKGDKKSILEVARCYREGDGVMPCICAAEAWERNIVQDNN